MGFPTAGLPARAVAALAIALASPAVAQAPVGSPRDLQARVEAYMEPLVALGLFSGAVLMARGGEVLVEKAWGRADLARGVPNEPSTRFKLMSVSKTFTAVAVLALVQDGRLGLEDPVAKHLSPWPDTWRDVRIHHLLDHTSELADLELDWTRGMEPGGERGLARWREVAPSFAGRRLEAAPGGRFAYSNFNFVVLGLIVEAASGKAYAEFVQERVLAPAGMTQTGFDDGSAREGLAVGCFRGKEGMPEARSQDMSVIRAAGGIFSTVGDLWRYDRALGGDALLGAETRALMLAPRSTDGTYACGWEVSPVLGRACVHHSGGANGYVADFLRFPEEDACVVVLSNFAFAPLTRIRTDLAGLLFGVECAPARAVAPATLERLAGVYANRQRTILARRSGATLIVFDVGKRTERCAGRLAIPLADDLFALPMSPGDLRFHPATDGAPAAIHVEPDDGAPPLARLDCSVAEWRAYAGEYFPAPAGTRPVRIAVEDDRAVLQAGDAWPSELELVPLGGMLALALVSEDFGTLLRLEGDDVGSAVGLRWRRNDGVLVEARRRN